jgi:hypothetical protein
MVRFAPGLSLGFLEPVPPQLGVTIDGESMTAMTRYDGREKTVDFLHHLPDALVYGMVRGGRVLVMEPGGGLGVLMALTLGSGKVDVVYEDPVLYQMVSERYGSFVGGILGDPRVEAAVMNTRSFLRQTGRLYGAIQYSPLSNQGAASTGLRGLQENYMFTLEAIVDAWNHLAPEGILSITQYLLPPPRQEIRLVRLVLEALARMEVPDPQKHLAIIRTWGTFSLLLKRSPFEEEEIRWVEAFCERERFDTVYYPGMTQARANRYNRFPHPLYYEMVRDLLSEGDRDRFEGEYLFDLRPVTDDNPFFFNFFRIDRIQPLYRAMRGKWQPLVEGGYLVPVVLIQSAIASALLIFTPLVFRRRGGPPGRKRFRLTILAYFAFLGLGYMFVEIVLIQKLILFLNHPVYAMATVISGLLLASGLGSYLSQSVTGERLRTVLGIAPFAVGFLVWAYLRFIPFFVDRFLGLSLGYREAVILVSLFPLGFLMGIPFPLGIRFLKESDPTTIPWAWCANGCFSVMGAVLSVVLALGIGFSRVLLTAGAIYVVAGCLVSVCFLSLTRHRDKADTPHVLNI